MRYCNNCERDKPFKSFGKNQSYCKQCNVEKSRAYRQTAAGKLSRKNRRNTPTGHAKHKARDAVNNAVSAGVLKRARFCRCEYCHRQAVHYHHHKGYHFRNRLNVVPICDHCHDNKMDNWQDVDSGMQLSLAI